MSLRLLPLATLFAFALAPSSAIGQADPAGEVRELQAKIDNAIDRGVLWLLSQQQRDGSWGSFSEYRGGATALCAYTLIKCGLPPTHSAVRRASLYLGTVEPQETYTIGCMLMFLHALGDPAQKKRIQQLGERLVTWQRHGYGYPFEKESGRVTERWTPEDLSNTQYAVLGLRAAAREGLAIKDEVWVKLAEDILRMQNLPEVTGQIGTKKIEAAGFRYRASAGKSTGSMTAAGIAVLTTCEESLGKRMPPALAAKLPRAIDLGMNWLAAHFVADKNPENDGWVLYWLYGVERVGAYRKVDRFGDHWWYLEGARFLVGKQGGSGDWWDGHPDVDTCFALLFLERASAPKTGGGESRKKGVHADDGAEALVQVRGQGGNDGTPLGLWIAGFAKKVMKDHAGDADSAVAGLRVLGVEYLANDKVIAKVDGDPARAWNPMDDFRARWTLEKRGKYTIKARVTVVEPEAEKGARWPVAVLLSKGFVVDAAQVHEAWMDDAARAGARNLLRTREVSAEASTINSEGQRALAAVDGIEGSAWCSKKDDPSPWLTIQLDKPVRADVLVLTHLNGRELERGQHDRATKVQILIPTLKEPVIATLSDDELAPAVIALPAAIAVRRIEILILERAPGQRWKGHVGFAEVALELRSASRR